MLLKVNEIFGPTIQGEGSAAGRHCVFIRLALCNLECKWCDTDYTWAFTHEKASKHLRGIVHDRGENLHELDAQQVITRLLTKWDIYDMPTIIVISGGEPMMQQEALMPLLHELNATCCEIHIETAGTIAPQRSVSFQALTGRTLCADFDKYVTQYNVSPKLAHSGNLLGKRYKPIVLKEFAKNPKAWFKFVLRSTDDLHEVDEMVINQGIITRRVMVMPEGVTVEGNIETARKIEAEAIARGYGLSFRSHILLWPNVERGR